MGVIGESIAAFAQPLLDLTDGSLGQLDKALSLALLCWNLALLPEEERDEALDEMRPKLNMGDEEFAEFRDAVVLPMIRRHEDMFPAMHQLCSRERASPVPDASGVHAPAAPRTEKFPGTGRNAPCPCNSGKKYKKCCGR